MSVPSGKILAQKLFNAAYRNGNIDAEDRWSDKKYREVAEEAKAALDAVVEALTAAEQRIATLEDTVRRLSEPAVVRDPYDPKRMEIIKP